MFSRIAESDLLLYVDIFRKKIGQILFSTLQEITRPLFYTNNYMNNCSI